MKKIIIAGCAIVLCAAMVACGSGDKKETSTADTTVAPQTHSEIEREQLATLFDSYSLDNGQQEAEEIMDAFLTDFPVFLEVLSEYQSQEQILMLVGMKVKAANANGDNSYVNAISAVDANELTEAKRQTLDAIKANIEREE